MAASLAHRGPDDAGDWADEERGVAFGFRRLAIFDLSPLGHQPMLSPGERFVGMLNGEVYNFLELRRELEASGCRFRSTSDTEVLLAACEAWGVEQAVSRFVGMFAIALWDRVERRLHLIRDRLGIKPLFVFQRPGLVLFASELKALMTHPEFEKRIDPAALTEYFRYLYVPAPATIFLGTQKLLPGHILTIVDPRVELPPAVQYWSARSVAESGIRSRRRRPDDEVVAETEALLRDAVALRMRADVPVGAFLSGGIDSSTVVALMQTVASRPVRTYTIGFSDKDYDERLGARKVAAHLGTDHTEVLLTAEDALALVPELPEIFDEPLADPSQLPTCLVSSVARRDVTVALSGDGGDEIFAGYNRYTLGERLFERTSRVPARPRRMVAVGIHSVSPEGWDRMEQLVAPILPSQFRQRLPGEKLHKLGNVLSMQTVPQMYRSLISAWQQPELLVRGGQRSSALDAEFSELAGADLLDRMMSIDQRTYLPDDLLAKVDRASMAVGLEARVPLLDHRVVEFSWTLPRNFRIRNGKAKWILREVLHRHVPEQLVSQAKKGFSVPIDSWLRGPLRLWAEDLLSEAALARTGMIQSSPIRREWQSLLEGRTRAGTAIWAVLMFQGWSERWLG